MRPTFSIDGLTVRDINPLIAFLESYDPDWIIVRDNAQVAFTDRLHARMYGKKTIVKLAGTDGINVSFTSRMTAQQYAKIWKETTGRITRNDEMIWYSLSEDFDLPKGQLVRFCQWLSEIVTILVADGYKLVVGNFDMMHTSIEEIQNGEFDPLITTLSMNPETTKLGVSEMAELFYPNGSGAFTAATVTGITLMNPPAAWPTWIDQDAIDNQTATLLRSDAFLSRQNTILPDAPTLDIMVTSLKLDRTPQSATRSRRKQPYDELAGVYGGPKGDLTGPYNLRALWAAYWPNLTFAQAYLKQIQWLDQVYPEQYKMLALYEWAMPNKQGEASYDHSADTELHTLLIDWKDTMDKPVTYTPPSTLAEELGLSDTVMIFGEPMERKIIDDALEELDRREKTRLANVEIETVTTSNHVSSDTTQKALLSTLRDIQPAPLVKNFAWQMARVSSVSEKTNIRFIPSILGSIVGHIGKDVPCMISEQGREAHEGYIWYPIRINAASFGYEAQNDFSNQGYIRADAMTYILTQQAEGDPNVVSDMNTISIQITYNTSRTDQDHAAKVLFDLVKLLEVQGSSVKWSRGGPIKNG